MKLSSKSLSRIYGESQLLSLHNRIRFVKAKQSHMKLPSTLPHTPLSPFTEHRQNTNNQKEQKIFFKKDLLTETAREGV